MAWQVKLTPEEIFTLSSLPESTCDIDPNWCVIYAASTSKGAVRLHMKCMCFMGLATSRCVATCMPGVWLRVDAVGWLVMRAAGWVVAPCGTSLKVRMHADGHELPAPMLRQAAVPGGRGRQLLRRRWPVRCTHRACMSGCHM